MGTEHRLSDSQVIGVMRVDTQSKASVFLREEQDRIFDL